MGLLSLKTFFLKNFVADIFTKSRSGLVNKEFQNLLGVKTTPTYKS